MRFVTLISLGLLLFHSPVFSTTPSTTAETVVSKEEKAAVDTPMNLKKGDDNSVTTDKEIEKSMKEERKNKEPYPRRSTPSTKEEAKEECKRLLEEVEGKGEGLREKHKKSYDKAIERLNNAKKELDDDASEKFNHHFHQCKKAAWSAKRILKRAHKMEEGSDKKSLGEKVKEKAIAAKDAVVDMKDKVKDKLSKDQDD